jgi:hypothetical protein
MAVEAAAQLPRVRRLRIRPRWTIVRRPATCAQGPFEQADTPPLQASFEGVLKLKMIQTRILAALALASALAACGKSQQPLKIEAPPSITGHVRVLDADVLVIDGQHLRLANAYGPESLLHARCWAESLAADHAGD